MFAIKKSKPLIWLPRLLAIALAVFLSLFALDVFDEKITMWQKLLALIIHLIPTWLILFALVVAWRRRMIGGVLFIVLGIAYIIISRASISAILLIAGPLMIIGVLFLLASNTSEYDVIRKSTLID